MPSLGQTFNRDRHFIDVSFSWMASVNLCSTYARLKTLKPFQTGWLVGEVRGAHSQRIFSFLHLQHHLSSETFQSFTVATIILVNLIGTSMKTFVYCANRTILNEKVRGCQALPGQLLSIQFLFSSLESWHLKRYTSGLKKKREREKKKDRK